MGIALVEKLGLIIKGRIITMVNQQPRAEAIGIKGGKITVVSSVDEVEKDKGSSTELLDLEGKTILPGFIDTHVHGNLTGMAILGVDLSSVETLDEVLDKIRERAKVTPAGEWILCFRFNRMAIREKRFPTMEELGVVSTEHPICLQHSDVHFCMLNSLGYKLINLPADLEGIHRDATGNFIGLVEDPASAVVMGRIEDLSSGSSLINNYLVTAQEALKVGVTTLHMKEKPKNVKLILKEQAKIPVRIKPLVFLHPMNIEKLEEVLSSDIPRDKACIAIIGDGSIEGYTAAFFEPYVGKPDAFGMLYYSDEELRIFLEKAHKAGFQVSIHAETDRCIEQVLAAYEEVLDKYPRKDHRHRIEHFEVPALGQISRVARAGIALGMQPIFITVAEGPNLDIYRGYMGDERVMKSNAFRSILDEGILVAGGSDSPVTQMSPLKGIQACVTHPNKTERISLYEALKLFTINGANIGFEEKEKGSIEKGKLADLVVLEHNPYEVPPEKIGNISVAMTIVGGKIVYKKE